MNITEKKEVVYSSYEKSFDKEMAYKKALLTAEEVQILNEDKEFQQRIEYCLILEREEIIQKLRSFKNSYNEKISFDATKELGRILYPEFFEEKVKDKKLDINLNIISDEEEARLKKELHHVLEDDGLKFQA